MIKACKTDSDGKVTPVSLLVVRKSKSIPFHIHWQVVEGKHTVYRMSASTEEEKDDWIKCIQ